MRRSTESSRLGAAALALALAASAPAAGQEPERPRDGEGSQVQEIDGLEYRELAWGLRLGAFEMVNSEDSYDAVYGDPMPMLGLQLDYRFRRGWLVEASVDYGRVDGELALLSDPPRGTGIEETLTYAPVHVTAAWNFYRRSPWDARVGIGPSFLWWESDSDLTGADGTEIGGSAAFSVRRGFPRWTLGGELRWSTFPDAVGDDGVTQFFDEDDLGGLSLHLIALWGR